MSGKARKAGPGLECLEEGMYWVKILICLIMRRIVVLDLKSACCYLSDVKSVVELWM